MEDISRFETLIEKFAELKEKYGNEYPIIFYKPNIEPKEKETFKDLISKNSSIHLFSESREAFQFAQSLGISFILIVTADYDESKLIEEFQGLKHTDQRRMLDFEEEGLLKDLFKNAPDQKIKSLKVYVFYTLLDCLTEPDIKEDEEEVMTMCDIKDIAKEFRQDFVVIWYDPDMNSESKAKLEEEIEIKIEEENTFNELSDLYEKLKNYHGTPYHLIMSKSEKAEKILKEIDKHQDLLGLYIYCQRFEKEKKIDNEKVEIRRTIEELVPRIKEGLRTRSILKNTFPAFATNFDTSDRTGFFKLHYYLKGLKNFNNRKQAKGDFIKLARKIYQDQEKELVRFEEKYNEYSREEILRWYTKESPIYKVINNCLRISSPDSILYCRLILKDLERAIREEYNEKSKGLSGVVYRGSYISTEEWEKIQRNIGEEIEMYGFLSTSVNQNTAVNFLRADLEKKILIKIIIPPLPEEDEQGFADISKFSEFQNEQEILFNVRSRFKILEAGFSEIDARGTGYRQLVLLYGAQSLRKYITRQRPSINIELVLPPDIKCNVCGSTDKLFSYYKREATPLNCLDCLIKGPMPKDTPLIALNGGNEKQIIKVLQGKILAHKEGMTFSNYGYKCRDCEAKDKEKYYKWLSCDGKDTLIQCSECLGNKRIIETEILLSESSPYAMWQEPQKEWETVHHNYQEGLPQRIELEAPGHVYIHTENNKECLKYAKKVLNKILKMRRKEISKLNTFAMLGEVFMKLGEPQQALTCWKNCQGLLKLIGLEKSSHGVIFYSELGSIFLNLAKHKEALESCKKALDLGRQIYKELHPVTASLYHGIAKVFSSLSKHEEALEYFTKSLDIQKSVLGEKHIHTADGYNSLGLFYRDLGRNQDALKYLSLALEIYELIFGEKHSLTANSYINLASIETDLGNHQKAIMLFHKAIDIQKSIHQGEHLAIASSYDNLAAVHNILGQYQEALKYCNKAFDINKSFYGEEHSRTATSLENLGMVWYSLGDSKKALEYLLKALYHRKSLFGEKHVEVAASYSNIGSVYKSLGEHKKTLEYFQKALDLHSILFAGPHPHKAASENNLAVAFETLGQYQKALEHHKNALDMSISLRGEKHSEISKSYNNIGIVYCNLGQYSKAIEHLHKALEINKLTFGELNPGNALSYNSLALSYGNLGDFHHAVEYSTKALEIQKFFHQGDHPKTATFYNNLGAVYIKMGEFSKAKEYLKKALKMRKAILTENHPDFATGYDNLGALYERLKKSQKAPKYYSKAIAIFEVVYGETHPSTAASYEKIGLVYSALGNRQEAIEYQKKSLKVKQKIYGENHALVATSYNNLGVCYFTSKKYQKARDHFLKSVEIKESLSGENHPDAYESYENLYAVYSKLGDKKNADEYFRKTSLAKEASRIKILTLNNP